MAEQAGNMVFLLVFLIFLINPAVLHSEMQEESPTASLKDIASIILEGYSTNH